MGGKKRSRSPIVAELHSIIQLGERHFLGCLTEISRTRSLRKPTCQKIVVVRQSNYPGIRNLATPLRDYVADRFLPTSPSANIAAEEKMEVVESYVQAVYQDEAQPDNYICCRKNQNQVELEDESTGKRHTVLTFCTNDVLGLTQSPLVKAAAINAIQEYGTSNGSCAPLSGRIDLHRELEQEISIFKHLPHTQLFLNAWMAMQALMDGFCHLAIPVPGFCNTRETLVLSDLLNHACILSAINNSGSRAGEKFGHSPKVRVKAYRHRDMENLAEKLRRFARPGDRIMVVSDSVFSMDGDIAPLPEMLDILEGYPGSTLVMDEAHASGAIGPTGGGIYDHFNISPQQALDRGVHPLIMTTFSKFAASAGAAISSHSQDLIKLLNIQPSSICTVSLPPPTTAAALESIRLVRRHPELVQRLQSNTRYLRSRLRETGFETTGETNVIPILLPAEVNPKLFARHLLEVFGIWVSPVWFIARPRLRVTVNAIHTRQEMDRFVDALGRSRTAFGFPPSTTSRASAEASTASRELHHDNEAVSQDGGDGDQATAGISNAHRGA